MRVVDRPLDLSTEYDVAISVCGYEPRSSYLCRLGLAATNLLAVTYPETEGQEYEKNRSLFSLGGWRFESADSVAAALQQLLASLHSPKVLVDISSMSRRTMADLIEYFWRHEATGEVHFVYAPARFESSAAAANVVPPLTAGPLSQFFEGSLRAPSIPVGLVLGLGLEAHRANGLVELLEPTRLWAFAAVSDDDRFVAEVEKMHAELFGDASATTLYYYDIRSIAELYNALESLVFSAGVDYRLLLAPSGPKVFSLAALLVGLPRAQPRPAIWRVGSSTPRLGPSDVVEAGDIVGAMVQFVSA